MKMRNHMESELHDCFIGGKRLDLFHGWLSGHVLSDCLKSLHKLNIYLNNYNFMCIKVQK